MKDMILGSEAIAFGVKLSKVGVISAYPITPQTHIVETLSEMVDKKDLNARFIKVESELSAAAAVLGASICGVRSFTATSSHGLALMHEILHWIAGSRLPIVMVNVNRAIGAPWNIWSDQTDSMSQRDIGWLQIYCETAQEALDSVIQAFYVAEKIFLPTMVMIDGFILSHTIEIVDIPNQDLVDNFLPNYQPKYYLDTDRPMAFGSLMKGDEYLILKKNLQDTMNNAFEIITEAHDKFFSIFKRKYNITEYYKTSDAEYVFVVAGSLAGTVKIAVDELRDKGFGVGLLRIKYFRPFPKKDIANALKNTKYIIVLNKSVSFGSGGTITQEIKDALYTFSPERGQKVYDFIVSLGGSVVFKDDLINIIEHFRETNFSEQTSLWMSNGGIKSEF